mgnify:FL=1|jgi:hypothetical protein
MTQLSYTVKFSKTVLAFLVGSLLNQTAFALEALSDDSLGDTTGEGIAFLPENFKMVFQQANDGLTTTQNAANLADRSKDTGFIRTIPVGPLTSTAISAGAKKADLFLYGLALSQTDNDVNSRFSNKGASSGTDKNPWVLGVETAQVPNFKGNVKSLSYLQIEAPWATSVQLNNTDTIKLGIWADLYARDPSIAAAVDPLKGAPNTTAGLTDKLRLQMIANGLYLNGSQIRIFQTLDGATNAGGLSENYNSTLGLGALLRLNTHYNSGGGGPANGVGWNDKVLRISTRELTGTAKDLTTPAISGGAAANFEGTEGVFIYSPNINLVLGSIYQPLIIDTPDGKNLSLEVTRIPNVAAVYNNIYTDYDNLSSATYKGSTCNVRYCGSNGAAGYQGNNATHSSISIGKVDFADNNRTLNITDKTINTHGITMNGPSGKVNLGSAAIDGLLIQHLKITTTGL